MLQWEAPECLARKPGEKPFNAKTDVFSFGTLRSLVCSGLARCSPLTGVAMHGSQA